MVVTQNEDGTLYITENGEQIKNPGNFIYGMGGIEAVLARCKEMTEEELIAENKRKLDEKAARIAEAERIEKERIACVEKAYLAVFDGTGTVEASPQNISILLSYLNTKNCGTWALPKMSIGYQCNQYDCDGRQATTIKLDTPIPYNGEMVSQFQTGAPRGHLNKYHRI